MGPWPSLHRSWRLPKARQESASSSPKSTKLSLVREECSAEARNNGNLASWGRGSVGISSRVFCIFDGLWDGKFPPSLQTSQFTKKVIQRSWEKRKKTGKMEATWKADSPLSNFWQVENPGEIPPASERHMGHRTSFPRRVTEIHADKLATLQEETIVLLEDWKLRG